MHCPYYEDARCRSCTELPLPYAQQFAARLLAVQEALAPFGPWQWLEPALSPETGFRNKAKMVVSGTLDAPQLGILDAGGHGIDLTGCPLYPPAMQAAFAPIAEFLARAKVVPYDLNTRRGEAKYVLITLAEASGELMVRFVLRSQEALGRLQRELPQLQRELPTLRVATVNLLPEHKAVTEGEIEIPLTEQRALRMQINGLPLYLQPRSFFQTNTAIAASLYRQARDWAAVLAPASIWDLYCGVGGFALHCASVGTQVIGIEISAEAIASAERSRAELGFGHMHLRVGDASDPTQLPHEPPELLIVNPPRRGLGAKLSAWIDASPIQHLIYSSCNADSLARDLALMPSLRAREARLFDMFPHTRHAEVAVLLSRV
jgi:23S rRNA (uracil747-C5)-methyltransferase